MEIRQRQTGTCCGLNCLINSFSLFSSSSAGETFHRRETLLYFLRRFIKCHVLHRAECAPGLKSARRQQGTRGTLIPYQTKAVPVLISSILTLANIKFYTVKRTLLLERVEKTNHRPSLKALDALDSQPQMNFLP